MKAIVITKPGGTEVLTLQDRPRPEPGVGQIRVRVHASALNRADLMQREGHYPAPPGVPVDIPGLEYAGEVDAMGPGAIMWTLGARVMGVVGGGAHAEFVCLHEREAIAIPHGMSFHDAAAIPEAFLTAYDALVTRAAMQAGERILIHAIASGVGTAALQIARACGAAVFGTSRSAAKLERAVALGLHHGIDSARQPWTASVEAIAGANGIHAVIDLVGGDYLASNLQVLAVRGRLVLVGLTNGSRAMLDMRTLLGKRITMIGTVLRARPLEEKITLAREFSERMLPLFASGTLRPIVDRVIPFADIRAAHDAMASDTTFGKIVLRWD